MKNPSASAHGGRLFRTVLATCTLLTLALAGCSNGSAETADNSNPPAQSPRSTTTISSESTTPAGSDSASASASDTTSASDSASATASASDTGTATASDTGTASAGGNLLAPVVSPAPSPSPGMNSEQRDDLLQQLGAINPDFATDVEDAVDNASDVCDKIVDGANLDVVLDEAKDEFDDAGTVSDEEARGIVEAVRTSYCPGA